MTKFAAALAAVLLLMGCAAEPVALIPGTDAAVFPDGGVEADSGVYFQDSGSGGLDAGHDAGQTPKPDSGTGVAVDAGGNDAGLDAGVIPPVDAGSDAGQVATDSGTGVSDAGLDSGTGIGTDAGMRVWVLEIWGYHVPDTRWTAGYASSSPWDPGAVYPATNPDVGLYFPGDVPDPDTDTLDRAPTGPRWSTTRVGTFLLVDFGPSDGDGVGSCGISAAEAAAARADGQLRTTTCATTGTYPLLTTGVTPDDVTATWRVVATYR